jgi:hypothetical protein
VWCIFETQSPLFAVHGGVCSTLYFDNQLGACSVEWSTKRMTL